MLPDKVSQCLQFAGQWRLSRATLAPEDPDDLRVQSPLSFSKLRLFLRVEAVLSFLVTLSSRKHKVDTFQRLLPVVEAQWRPEIMVPSLGATLSPGSHTDFPYSDTSCYLCVCLPFHDADEHKRKR